MDEIENNPATVIQERSKSMIRNNYMSVSRKELKKSA